MIICYTYYMNIDDKHDMNMQKNDNTNFFYQRTILNSLNLTSYLKNSILVVTDKALFILRSSSAPITSA